MVAAASWAPAGSVAAVVPEPAAAWFCVGQTAVLLLPLGVGAQVSAPVVARPAS